MSSFTVQAQTITVKPHPDADAIELAHIDGMDYVSIVRKDENLQTGDVVLYIPEQALIPESILRELNLWDAERGVGKLAGSKGNRVKAVRLRGVLSQGLIYKPKNMSLVLEKDYAEELQITKYMPAIPMNMSGKVNTYENIRSYTNIENHKKFPDIFSTKEMVVATEKIHGTNVVYQFDDNGLHVSSKGLSSSGFELDFNEDNVYWRVALRHGIAAKLQVLRDKHYPGMTIMLYGEIFGVQDLKYGLPKGQLDFRAFDIMITDGHDYTYLNYQDFITATSLISLPTVPVLYYGPFDEKHLTKLSQGMETISGKKLHIREGIVVRPVEERRTMTLGRVILKMINPEYLLRKNGMELE